MAITDYKISETNVYTRYVQSAPSVLTGTVKENQEVFDKLPMHIVEKHNGSLDEIANTFATQSAMVEGIRNNLQEQIDALGDSVNPLSPMGLYATIEDLQEAHPTGEVGESWLVGSSASNVVYLWDVDQEQWVNVGSLVGGNGFKSAYNKNFEDISSNIEMDGVASAGNSENVARADHVHPTDTSRASQADMLAVQNITNNLLDFVYPIGSIYMSVSAVSPATLFGGTWEAIQDRFLLASGTAYTNGSTGGSATVTLTAAQSGVPAHTHGFTQPTISSHSHVITDDSYNVTTNATQAFSVSDSGSGVQDTNVLHSPSGQNLNRGSKNTKSAQPTASGGAVQNSTAKNATTAHNNMPPYLVVNIWKRTA